MSGVDVPAVHFFLTCVRVRVYGGHLCKAEAPTEAAAETVTRVTETEEEKMFE